MVMPQAQRPQQWAVCRGEPTPLQCNLCLKKSRCLSCSRPGLDCITIVVAYILRVQARCASIASMGRQSVLAGACCTSNHCLAEATSSTPHVTTCCKRSHSVAAHVTGLCHASPVCQRGFKERRVRPHFAGHTLQLQQNLVKRTPAVHTEAAAATAPCTEHQAGSETVPCKGAKPFALAGHKWTCTGSSRGVLCTCSNFAHICTHGKLPKVQTA